MGKNALARRLTGVHLMGLGGGCGLTQAGPESWQNSPQKMPRVGDTGSESRAASVGPSA